MNTDKKDLGAFLPGFLTKISVHPRLFVVNFDLRNTLLDAYSAKVRRSAWNAVGQVALSASFWRVNNKY